MYPCWSTDGGRVFFTRFGLDTDGDGRLGRNDSGSIFSVLFTPAVFSGKEAPPPRQLTSYAMSEAFPRPLPGGFLFTRIAEGGGSDIFALGESGEMPDLHRISEFVRFAEDSGIR